MESPKAAEGHEASVQGFFARVRGQVDARIGEILDEARAVTEAEAPDTLPMFDAARDLTLRGGKRLRPAMLLAAIACCQADPFSDAATDLGAAMELLQTYLLVHDDWMDDDPIRRGGPSVHVLLAEAFGGAHLGACTAILAGDLMGALVHKLIADLDLPTPRRREVNAVWASMEHEVILGQCLDVTQSRDVARIHRLKTGSYTVRGPLRLGAAVAAAHEPARAALMRYAEPLGLAFQLRDDVLGVFGSERETGKPVGNDLREGKQTALAQHAMAHLDAAGQNELQGIVGRRDASEADVLRARDLIERSGALAAAEAQIASLRAQCLEALDERALLPRGAELLAALATMVTERTR
ncbi:MAG: polyprenyl synthetase family protein [Polyangiales bacterium]